jgi:GGDEF domain-containing protein
MSDTTQEALTPRDERQTMGRIAAAIWAAIALFGAIASFGPLSSSGVEVSAMRTVVASAAVMSGIVLLVPWHRLPMSALTIPLLLMSVSIGALADAANGAGNSMLILLAFVVVLAAYYLPTRSAVVQLVFVALVLAARVVSLDSSDMRHQETLRVTLMMAALVALFCLVRVLRSAIRKREDMIKAQDVFDYQTGLLSAGELDRVLTAELSRSSRHARPLSVVMVRLSGRMFEESGTPHVARLLTLIARSLLGRIRVEDTAARLDDLSFAIIAPETNGAGAMMFAEMTAEVIRRRLLTLGYEEDAFSVAYGWADYPQCADDAEGMLKVAGAGLETYVGRKDGTPTPAGSPPAAALATGDRGPASHSPGFAAPEAQPR